MRRRNDVDSTTLSYLCSRTKYLSHFRQSRPASNFRTLFFSRCLERETEAIQVHSDLLILLSLETGRLEVSIARVRPGAAQSSAEQRRAAQRLKSHHRMAGRLGSKAAKLAGRFNSLIAGCLLCLLFVLRKEVTDFGSSNYSPQLRQPNARPSTSIEWRLPVPFALQCPLQQRPALPSPLPEW